LRRPLSRRFSVAALVLGSTLAAHAVAQPVDRGLIALYKANGSAQDCVGGCHGVLNAVTFAPGRFGQAFHFDGGTSFVEIPGAVGGGPPASGDFTVALWVYANPQAGFREFVAKGMSSVVGGDSFYVGVSANDEPQYSDLRMAEHRGGDSLFVRPAP